jgi:hypothetical protein
MPTNVFVSIGTCFTDSQIKFAEALDLHLKANGLTPVRAKSSPRREDTLPLIEEALDKCSGTIVVAFERMYAPKSKEFRQSVLLQSKSEQDADNVKVTTVWNQIEAALAESRGQPLLLLVEKDVRIDGFLEWNTWKLTELDISPADFSTDEFKEDFQGWKELVDQFKPKTIRTQSMVAPRPPRSIASRIGLFAASALALAVVFGAGAKFGYDTGSQVLAKPD